MKGDIKQIVILVVSVLVGFIAAAVSHVYLKGKWAEIQKMRQEVIDRRQKVSVVAPRKTLPRGTTLRHEDLGKIDVRKFVLGDQSIPINRKDSVIGKRLLFQVDKNQPLQWYFLDTGFQPSLGLGTAVRKRLRAVSISAGGTAGVSGHIRPNDRVDVLGTFAFPSKTVEGEMETVTMTMLQNVTVLTVGHFLPKEDLGSRTSYGRSQGYSTVTLLVSPQEAELLVFSEHMRGKMSLTLRNPEDMHYLPSEDLQKVDFEDLEKKIPEYNKVRQENIIGRRFK